MIRSTSAIFQRGRRSPFRRAMTFVEAQVRLFEHFFFKFGGGGGA